MASERELLKRIKSVKNISQVTSALSAVSASRASQASRRVETTRAYAGKAFELLNGLASKASNAHPLLESQGDVGKTAVLVISSDRGLAGAYSSNITRRAQDFIDALTEPVQLVTVGKKGTDLMVRRGYEVVASFDGYTSPPDFIEILPIARVVMDDYLEGKVDKVFIAYTDFINMVTQRPTVKQLLPLKPLDMEGMAAAEHVEKVDVSSASEASYDYEPEPGQLLAAIVPRFTRMQVYQTILESLASEHSARMVAMNNATENANELIDALTLERNKARQATITNEILDIAGGAEALAQQG